MSIYICMGGEAGIGGIEGGAPQAVVDKNVSPIPSENKPVKSEEQKKAEKEKRVFDNKVAILAHKLWGEDGYPKIEGPHYDYVKRAEKIIKKRDEVNARRRKRKEDKKKREEPTPGHDIFNAPPDQSGEGTAGTEEIARSEAHTQQHAAEQPQETGQETQKPVSDDELFSKMIKAIAISLGIDPKDMSPALVENMRERFLAKQAAKQKM